MKYIYIVSLFFTTAKLMSDVLEKQWPYLIKKKNSVPVYSKLGFRSFLNVLDLALLSPW